MLVTENDIRERICEVLQDECINHCNFPYCRTVEEFVKAIELKNIQRSILNEYTDKLKEELMSKGIYPVLVKNAMQTVKEKMLEGDTNESRNN